MTAANVSVEDFGLRLARLEAESALRKIVGHYALAADRRNDPTIMAGLFTQDAIWEAVGFGRYVGRDAIAQGLSEIAERQVVWSIHYMVSPIIDLSDDVLSARCRWYLWELSTLKNDDGAEEDSWLGGWYDAQARNDGGAWRFSNVLLDVRLASPVSAPWQGKKAFDPNNNFGLL